MKASVIKIYLLTCLSFFSVHFLSAQKMVHDPLGKPELWKLIKIDYQDTKLWAKYVGVPWEEMPESTKKLVTTWQAELAEFNFTNGVIVLAETVVEEDVESDEFWGVTEQTTTVKQVQEQEEEIKATQEKVDYLKDLKEMMLIESDEEEVLKANINQNFLIIEDMYFEEYAALGAKYVFYETVYPDFSYDQVQWVEDKAKELKMLKEKKYNSAKGKISKGGDIN